ncbi:XRE family transcriptional regulator [soil metagenome]
MGRRRIQLDEFDEALGAHLRALRKRRGLTLVQLAAQTDLSHPFLSLVERGRARASFDSLEVIARQLGSSHAEVVTAARVKSSSELQPPTVYAHGSTEVLSVPPAPFSVLRIKYTDTKVGTFYSHAEDEFLLILEGTAELEVEGRDPVRLVAGDFFQYPGGSRHRWRAIDNIGFSMIAVKQDPLFEH